MSSALITVKVERIKQVAPTIKEFSLKPVKGYLTPFSPGSHVVVEMKGKHKVYRNAYSLLSDPANSSSYKIAVRLQEKSRGGSTFMHQSVNEGDELNITPPANLFAPEWQAKKHLMLAGGIGITPFMAYLAEFSKQAIDFELVYLYRGDTGGAYLEELGRMLTSQNFTAVDSCVSKRADILAILQAQPLGTHIYICGPEPLINDVLESAKKLGWPLSHIHYEAFTAPKPGKEFDVELAVSKQSFKVASDESLLESLEANDIEVPNLCRGGVCGQCRLRVLEGEVDHHDDFLSHEEQAEFVMPCVSRAKSNRLVLDI